MLNTVKIHYSYLSRFEPFVGVKEGLTLEMSAQ